MQIYYISYETILSHSYYSIESVFCLCVFLFSYVKNYDFRPMSFSFYRSFAALYYITNISPLSKRIEFFTLFGKKSIGESPMLFFK